MTNEEKPAGSLPPLPWKADRGIIGNGGSGLIAVTITDADGAYLGSVRGDHADAFAALLLRAPRVEIAARELSDHLWRVLQQGERSLYDDDTHELMVALRAALGGQR